MAGLEGRLGGLVADVRNLADWLKKLAEEVSEDHDTLNPLPGKIEEVLKAAKAAEAAALAARKYAEDEIDALKQSLEEGVNKRGDRWFNVVMAAVGVVGSLLATYLTVKFGLSKGG